jgi:hypothetical protein
MKLFRSVSDVTCGPREFITVRMDATTRRTSYLLKKLNSVHSSHHDH